MEAAAIPAFDATGDLPPGIYRATLDAIQARFCTGEVRAHWGRVLREVVALAQSTERVEAMYIFGSFVTAKAAPADLDLFVIMAADFTSERVEGRARLLFPADLLGQLDIVGRVAALPRHERERAHHARVRSERNADQ